MQFLEYKKKMQFLEYKNIMISVTTYYYHGNTFLLAARAHANPQSERTKWRHRAHNSVDATTLPGTHWLQRCHDGKFFEWQHFTTLQTERVATNNQKSSSRDN
jgi:hypothetical protein